jgi:hypothetical protein
MYVGEQFNTKRSDSYRNAEVHAVNRTLYHKIRGVMRKVFTTWHNDVSLIMQRLVIHLSLLHSI